MWNNPFSDALDQFETSTCEPTQAGLATNISCICGRGIAAVEPWVARQAGESSVQGAFAAAPRPLQHLLAYAKSHLQPGAGFSHCAIDVEGIDPMTGERKSAGRIIFAVFIRCQVCNEVAVASDDVAKVRSALAGMVGR